MTTGNKYILCHAGAEFMPLFKKYSKLDIDLINPVLANPVLKILRRLTFKIAPFLSWVWVARYFSALGIKDSENNVFVLFDADVWLNNIGYVKKRYPRSRVVMWYWNIVKDPDSVVVAKKYADDVYTFDLEEAKKYGIGYRNQFYWMPLRQTSEISRNIYDVMFIGRSKGRLALLENIYKRLTDQGLRLYFYVVKDSAQERSDIIELRDSFLPYMEVCSIIEKSSAILDILQPGQSGMTLRALESVFWKKKLITDNEMVQSEKFYVSGNIIYVSDVLADDNSYCRLFINSPFVEISAKLILNYTVDHWLSHIGGGND